jgi:hypothetical protein
MPDDGSQVLGANVHQVFAYADLARELPATHLDRRLARASEGRRGPATVSRQAR